jgi:hypothetical protein
VYELWKITIKERRVVIQKLHMPIFGGVEGLDPDPGFLENPDPDPGFLENPDPDPAFLENPDPDPSFLEKPDPDPGFLEKLDPDPFFLENPDLELDEMKFREENPNNLLVKKCLQPPFESTQL